MLVLARHSLPAIELSRPAHQWSLSPEGCRRAVQLAALLACYDLELLVSSEEPKAVQTAAIVGEELGLPAVVVQGLHEHERSGVVGLDGEAFRDGVARVFRHPQERVFGEESAEEAHGRFSGALNRVLARHPGQNLGVVAHGTVLALFVAGREGRDPYALWQSLGLPCAFMLSRPELRVIEWMAEVLPGSRGAAVAKPWQR